MADLQNEQITEITDLTGGIQDKTTEFLQKPGELQSAFHARFDTIGGIKKGLGYIQQGSNLTSTSSTSTSTSTTTTSTSTSTTSTSTSSSTSTTTTA